MKTRTIATIVMLATVTVLVTPSAAATHVPPCGQSVAGNEVCADDCYIDAVTGPWKYVLYNLFGCLFRPGPVP